MGSCIVKDNQVLNKVELYDVKNADDIPAPQYSPPSNRVELHDVQNADNIPAPKNKFQAYVCDVYDGDTITIIYNYRNEPFQCKLRLVGINAPEIRTKNLQEKKNGLDSKEYLKSLIFNKYVWVKITGPDKYYRLDGKVFLTKSAESSVNDDMIAKGYAVEYDI